MFIIRGCRCITQVLEPQRKMKYDQWYNNLVRRMKKVKRVSMEKKGRKIGKV